MRGVTGISVDVMSENTAMLLLQQRESFSPAAKVNNDSLELMSDAKYVLLPAVSTELFFGCFYPIFYYFTY